MRRILIIGIGAGHPDYLTVQAIDAMRRADLFFMPDKGAEKAGLNAIRLQMLERFVPEGGYRLVDFVIPARRPAATPEYKESVGEWRDKLEAAYRRLFAEDLRAGETGAFLVWGDPAIYDGTLRIIDDMRTAGHALEVEVIPGISAVQALAARHQITLNRVGEPITITTGRRVGEGEADGLSSAVVMLDNHQVFRRFDGEAEIFWGAYLGTQDEILIAGKVTEVAAEIVRVRAEAQAKHGWIMDTYMIRKPEKD
jgi:precorrin-6A synthase